MKGYIAQILEVVIFVSDQIITLRSVFECVHVLSKKRTMFYVQEDDNAVFDTIRVHIISEHIICK